jgi:hypothetical protein
MSRSPERPLSEVVTSNRRLSMAVREPSTRTGLGNHSQTDFRLWMIRKIGPRIVSVRTRCSNGKVPWIFFHLLRRFDAFRPGLAGFIVKRRLARISGMSPAFTERCCGTTLFSRCLAHQPVPRPPPLVQPAAGPAGGATSEAACLRSNQRRASIGTPE